jgi:lysophospholipase L1-like esterase
MASLSRRIVQTAHGRAAGIIDMHRAFSDDKGEARPGMTADGIHLSAQGYRSLHGMLERVVVQVTDRHRESR